MRSLRLGGCAIAAATMLLGLGTAIRAQVMIVSNDQKPKFDDGKVVMQPSGHDTPSIIDMSKPASLRIVATIPLDNTIVGPPTNLAITPKDELALVARLIRSMASKKTADGTPSPTIAYSLWTSRPIRRRSSPPSTLARNRPEWRSTMPARWPSSPIATTARSRCCRSTVRKLRSLTLLR
jgi:hypothetical protein